MSLLLRRERIVGSGSFELFTMVMLMVIMMLMVMRTGYVVSRLELNRTAREREREIRR